MVMKQSARNQNRIELLQGTLDLLILQTLQHTGLYSIRTQVLADSLEPRPDRRTKIARPSRPW